MSLGYPPDTLTAATDAVAGGCDGGFLRLYAGTRPADPLAQPDGEALVELRFDDPAFAPATSGVARANPLSGANAERGGRATWFRAFRRDGRSPVFDGDVGTGAADLVLTSADLPAGGRVEIGTFTLMAK